MELNNVDRFENPTSYQARQAPAKWLTVEAIDADAAIEAAAKKFGDEPQRLIAVRAR